MQYDILAMFDDLDLPVTDVSSLGLDFLYLRPDRPLLLTDRRTDRVALIAESPIAVASPTIDAHSVMGVHTLIEEALADDGFAEQRGRQRAHYFGEGPRVRRLVRSWMPSTS